MKRTIILATAVILAAAPLTAPRAFAGGEPPAKQEESPGEIERKAADIGKKLDELDGKLKESTEETKSALSREMGELREKQKVLQEKLQEMKAAGGKAWSDVKKGAEGALNELQNAYEKARERFR